MAKRSDRADSRDSDQGVSKVIDRLREDDADRLFRDFARRVDEQESAIAARTRIEPDQLRKPVTI